MRTFLILLPGLLSVPATAQCEIARLVASGSPGFNETGSLDGDQAFLGSSSNTMHAFERGPSGWSESARRTIPGSYLFDWADIGGREGLFVGGAEEGENLDIYGRAYVSEATDGFTQWTRLEYASVEYADGFGSGFAVSGDVLVAGAAQQIHDVRCGPGKAYVFERRGGVWCEAARLDPHGNHNTMTEYGRRMDFDGTTIAMGSHGDDELNPILAHGAVYLYEKRSAGWSEVAKLFPSDAGTGLQFGYRVAVSGDYLLASAHGKQQVYAFERTESGWSEVEILHASDAQPGDMFGASVALEGELAVIGAPGVDHLGATNVGAIYVFRRQNGHWEEVRKLIAEDASAQAQFGSGLDLDRNRVLWWGPTNTAYLHALGIEELEHYCEPSQNSTGTPATIAAEGCDSVLANALTLSAAHLPPQRSASLVFGKLRTQVPFGNGWLCIGQPLSRLPPLLSDASGALRTTLDFSSPPANQIAAGTTWSFQWIHRDPGFGSGVGSSDGVSVLLAP